LHDHLVSLFVQTSERSTEPPPDGSVPGQEIVAGKSHDAPEHSYAELQMVRGNQILGHGVVQVISAA